MENPFGGHGHAPLPFGRPEIQRGRRDTVLVWDSNKHVQCHDVLLRDDVNNLQTAYWSTQKQTIETIFGHVQICLILRRSVAENDSDSENDSDEDDIVFEFTQEYVAVKVNYCERIDALRNKHAEDPMKEIAAMQTIRNDHPNVLGCLEVLYDGRNINLVLPYCRDGDLFELLRETQRSLIPGLPEERARFYFRQIILGVQHLHQRGVCHRDLSPENIMIDQNQTCCIIIDMGMCLRVPYLNEDDAVVDISGGTTKLLIAPQGACGKLPYMAPEIYANTIPFDGESVDVWSCGAILFCMLTGNRSYQLAHTSDPQFYWMSHNVQILLDDWNLNLSSEAVEMLSGMLKINPEERMTLEEIITHRWFDNP